MKHFSGKRVTVVGLGEHGGAVGNIRWLHEQEAKLTVTDLKPANQLSDSLEALSDLTDIKWILGEHREDDFRQTDMVVRNPAVPRSSKFLEIARRAGVPIEMDSSLFFRFSPTRNIFGVTGSKGKTTATRAIAHLLQLKFANVAVIGTEGSSPLAELSNLHAEDAVVFELSSWRLEALADHKISPPTSVITSLYEDHLNTYDSMEEYEETKKTVIRFQTADDLAILNYDDDRVRPWREEIQGRAVWFTLGPDLPGSGICVERGVISIMKGRDVIPLFPLENISMVGEHQRRNILPAIYLAFCSGIRIDSIKMHLTSFSGVSHRLENIRTINNVTYINDSASTIPDATIAAIKAFSDKHLVLIIGGSDKRLNFERLARTIAESRIRTIIFLPGNATPRLRASIESAHQMPLPMLNADSMTEAVARAKEAAQPNDVVLLSPGATSFGLFRHEFDRGDQFKDIVSKLEL